LSQVITQSDSPLIYSVVLNWNQPEDTLACLDSLARQDEIRQNLLIVDNASTDDSVQRIQACFPQAEILVNPSNLGFGRGFNCGVGHAFRVGADYVFIANNDTFLEPHTISTLLRHMTRDVGLLAPAIYYASHPEVIWSMGGKTNRWNLEVIEDVRGKPDPGNWPDVLERDFVTGCGLLIPRETFERVGLFDDRFQMYYEDSDLSHSIRRVGLRILVIPGAKMWHKVALSSGGSDSPNERYWMARSSTLFFRKHARGIQWPVIIFWRMGSTLRTTLRLSLHRKWQSLAAYWRGLRDGLRDPQPQRQ